MKQLEQTEIKTIPFTEIIVKENIRQDYGNIKELALSIEENGLKTPIVITPNKELFDGHRRYNIFKHKFS